MENQEEYIEKEEFLDSYTENNDCQCEECVKAKDRYVRIFDMDRFVDNLNDWD